MPVTLWAAVVIFILAEPAGEFKYDVEVFTEQHRCEQHVSGFSERGAEMALGIKVRRLIAWCERLEVDERV